MNDFILTGVEIQCIGHFKLLFSFFREDIPEEIKIKLLSLLVLVTRNQECISDISASGVLIKLLLILYSLPAHRYLILTVLHALITSSAIVKDFIQKGKYYLYEVLTTFYNLLLE